MRSSGLLGSVESITRSRLILVKIEKKDVVPSIGSKVIDANGAEIGWIMDIIGRVDQSYAVVKPLSYSVLSFVKPSTVLFYKSTKHTKRPRRE